MAEIMTKTFLASKSKLQMDVILLQDYIIGF